MPVREVASTDSVGRHTVEWGRAALVGREQKEQGANIDYTKNDAADHRFPVEVWGNAERTPNGSDRWLQRP